MKRILSIDGGGIRGIIPGMVLTYLEATLQKQSGNKSARIADYFDFVAGTSTGGILACVLLCPENPGSKRPKFTAEQAVNLYIENGDKIFYPLNSLTKFLANYGLRDERFKSKGFEEIMEKYFKKTKLSDLLKPCLIAAYETELRQTYFFGKHKAVNYPKSRDYYLYDVCRATSAAPSYFEAARVTSIGGVEHSFVDGGIFANNPSLCAYAEVRKAEDEPRAQDMFVFSIGTGSTKRSYDFESIRNKLAAAMIPALIDMMMSGVSETTHFQLKKMFEAVNRPHQYVRIEPENLNNVNEDMDDASIKNMRDLQTLGDATAQQYREVIDKVADVLIKESGDQVQYKKPETQAQ